MREPTTKRFRLPALAACVGLLAAAVLQAPLTASAGPKNDKGGSGLPFSEELADLGDQIFDDKNLSIGRNQACNTCHAAEWGFTGSDSAVNAAGAVYEGSILGRFGNRKPPSSAYSTLSPILRYNSAKREFVGGNFFDGRATGEKLGNAAADQAQGPFLNPVEQGLRDSACVVHRVSIADYAPAYREIWGGEIDTIVFPTDIDELCSVEGPPLEIEASQRAAIEREYDRIAISIAVYEESHGLFTSKFDAMRKGLYKFDKSERRGFALFQGKAKCSNCHTSQGQNPTFTDHTYDNVGAPANPDNPVYAAHPGFVDNGLGGFLASRPDYAGFAAAERGKMRVPTLRNVDMRPDPSGVKAYMHNGVFKSLEEVVRFYNTRDTLPYCGPSDARADWGQTCWPAPEVADNLNTAEMGALGLSQEEEADLVAFMKTLSDGHLPSPRGRR